MALNKAYLKYPLYLFLAIFIAKIGYIIIESFYNYHVLVTTTSAELSQEAIEELNLNGHRISSVGITLLLIPFFYLLVKRFSNTVMYSTLLILSIASYFGSYTLLNKTVDHIVKTNKEKRHDAYYVNIFKYGILNNIFAYNSFLDNQKVQESSIDVNDRILLTNTFLLLHADEKLIDKLKQRGKEKVADIYISKYKKDDYEMSYKSFEEATKHIQVSWDEFNKARNDLAVKLKELEDEKSIKEAHSKLVASLKTQYMAYVDAWNEVDAKIQHETTPDKLQDIKNDLNKYFRYQHYEKAKQEYKKTMQIKFGHYIEPNRWLDGNNNVSTYLIKKVIKEEALNKTEKKSKGIPQGLNAKSFINHLDFKIEVAKQLKEKGILIPFSFDYSYAQFKNYFQIAATKQINEAPGKFYAQLSKKIGENDLKLNFTWDKFIQSQYIKNQIKSKLNTNDQNDIRNITEAIRSKDLGNFKRLVYLPKVIDEVDKMMYKPEDFLDGGKAAKVGDDAIKLLYIPPFALSVSIIALLLNLVTVFGMLLVFSNKFSTVPITIAKFGLMLVLVFIPIVSSYKSLDNAMLDKIKTPELTLYLDFLEWISYYEQVNAKLH